MNKGVFDKHISGTIGTTGVERLEVIITIGILRTFEQTFIVESPISRSNTSPVLNSFVISANCRFGGEKFQIFVFPFDKLLYKQLAQCK